MPDSISTQPLLSLVDAEVRPSNDLEEQKRGTAEDLENSGKKTKKHAKKKKDGPEPMGLSSVIVQPPPSGT